MTSVICPCGSEQLYENCCGPLISNHQHAATPEALMRSRYTAFTQGNIDYLIATMTMDINEEEARDFVKNTQWLGLDIHEVTNNMVEFSAYFILDGIEQRMHERSLFIQENGKWLYDGHEHQCSEHITQEPIRVEKIGRNEPCPCGSGKKYKKCCQR